MLNIDQAKLAVQVMTARAKAGQRTAMRRDLALRLQYYEGDQVADTEEALRDRFPGNDRAIGEYLETYNLTKEIVDARSQVVWRSPDRTLYDAAGNEVTDQVLIDLWEFLVRKGELNSRMEMFNRYSNLWKNCIVWPRFRDNGAEQWIKWDAFSAASLWVTQDEDNPDELDAAKQVIILLAGRTDTSSIEMSRFGIYTQEDYGVAEGTIQGGYPLLYRWIQEPAPHGLGCIPLVNFPDGLPIGEMWACGGRNLIDANRAINAKLTDTSYLFAMQSHGQMVIMSDDPKTKIEIGPGKAIRVDPVEGASVTYVQPGGRLSEAQEWIDWTLKAHANEHNLSPNRFAAERQALSGIAKVLDELDLIEDVGRQQRLFLPREADLFRKTAAVWNASVGDGRKFPDGTEQRVSYVPYTLPTDPLVEIEAVERRIKLGAVPAYDAVKMVQPDLTDEEAEEQWRENLAMRKDTIAAETPLTGPAFNFDLRDDEEEPDEPVA